MRRLFLSLALLIAGLSPAGPSRRRKRCSKRSIRPICPAADFDWSSWDEAQFRSADLKELYDKDAKEADGEVGRLDFDPFIDGQDYEIKDLVIGEPAIAGDAATVPVSFSNFGMAEKLQFSLVKEADGWKVDDVVSSNADFPYSLKALLEAPL